MSSVVTTSENGLKMKIQRKGQRQVTENNNLSVSILPPKQKNAIGKYLATPKEDYPDNTNKAKKTTSDSLCGKFQNSKLMHAGKNKCKNKKQAKMAKEKKIKKKFDKIVPLNISEEKDSTPEDDTIPFSSSSSPSPFRPQFSSLSSISTSSSSTSTSLSSSLSSAPATTTKTDDLNLKSKKNPCTDLINHNDNNSDITDAITSSTTSEMDITNTTNSINQTANAITINAVVNSTICKTDKRCNLNNINTTTTSNETIHTTNSSLNINNNEHSAALNQHNSFSTNNNYISTNKTKTLNNTNPSNTNNTTNNRINNITNNSTNHNNNKNSNNNLNNTTNNNTDNTTNNKVDNSTNNNTNNIIIASSTQLSPLKKHCEKPVCTKMQKACRISTEITPQSLQPPSCVLTTSHHPSSQPPTFPLTNQSNHPSIDPSTHPSIHSSTHPSIHSSTHPSIYSTTHPSIHSFPHPSIHSSTHPSIHSSTHPSIHSFTHPSIHSSSLLSMQSTHTSTQLSTNPSNLSATHQSTTPSIHQSSHPSIHPNIATPPSTPPCQTSLSPLNLHRICHDVHTDTNDMAVSTDPDCLGPCEPGTSVVLEGIVWNESDNGILVVNVTWRGKTYVGTLMDSTRHDWAPPRFIEDDLTPAVNQNYHHYYSWTSCSSSSSSSIGNYFQKSRGEELTAGGSNEVRKLRKCRKDAAAILSQQQHASTTPSHTGRVSVSSNKALTSSPFEREQSHTKTGFFECPSSGCLKKFRHLAGLRYHQSHAHSQQKRGRPETFSSLTEFKNISKSPVNDAQVSKDRFNKGKDNKYTSSPAKNTSNGGSSLIKYNEKLSTNYLCKNEEINGDIKINTSSINNTIFNISSNTTNIGNTSNSKHHEAEKVKTSSATSSPNNFLESKTTQQANSTSTTDISNNNDIVDAISMNSPSIPDNIHTENDGNNNNNHNNTINTNIKNCNSIFNGDISKHKLKSSNNYSAQKNYDSKVENLTNNIASENNDCKRSDNLDNITCKSSEETTFYNNKDKKDDSQINVSQFTSSSSLSTSSSSSSLSSLSSSTTTFPFSNTNLPSSHDNTINKKNLNKKESFYDGVIIENNKIIHSAGSKDSINTENDKDNKKLNEILLQNDKKENIEKETKGNPNENKACTKINSLFPHQRSGYDTKDHNEIKRSILSNNKNDNTCNDGKKPNKMHSTNTTTTIINTTSMTNIITSNTSTTTSTKDANIKKLNVNTYQSGIDEQLKSAPMSSNSTTTTTFYNVSTNVIATTTITSNTIINSMDKQESNCNYIAQNNHFKADYHSVNPNKPDGRHDDDVEEIKINKASDESRSDAKAKIFDSYYENKIVNKKFIDNKIRPNDRSVSKESDGRMEAESWKKTPNSIAFDSHKSSKEREERSRERLKDNRKPPVYPGMKPPETNNSGRKHQYPSSDHATPTKKAKMEQPYPAASEAEAFYKSFQSIFGNPPLPLDLFMDPFYRIAMMSDPLIFHKNLIEAQTQMAKSLTSGGFSMPQSGMPFSFLNPLPGNDHLTNRTEETKPVDMSSKKSNSQGSPKMDSLSSRSWPSYLLPPTSSSHFFGPLKDSGSDVTSRPLFDFFNDPNIFNKELSQKKISPNFNQSNSNNLLNVPNSSHLSNKSYGKNSSSTQGDQARYYSNNYQNNFNSDRMKRYDDYINNLNSNNISNNNGNTFNYSSQTNKGRVREDPTKKMYSPKLSASPTKRQDIFKNPLTLPTLLSQPFSSFDQISQPQHLQPSNKTHPQSNYNAVSAPSSSSLSSSSSSNFYYHSSQQQQSPQYSKLISPFKSKNTSIDPASKQNSKMKSFYQNNNYYNNYNNYNNINNNINNNNTSKPMVSSSSSSLSSSYSSSSSYPSSSSYSSSSSTHLYSTSSATKQMDLYHLPHLPQLPTPSLPPYNQYSASSISSSLLHPTTAVSDMYGKK